MKKDTHPSYEDVLFIDSSNGEEFICGSTLQSEEKQERNGIAYSVIRLPVTSASHPFFTGSDKLVDAEGRVEKFRNRYKAATEKAAKVKDEIDQHKQSKLEKVKKKVKK